LEKNSIPEEEGYIAKNKRIVDTDRLDIPFLGRMIEYGQKRVSVLL
jgi:hypothetical protein